MFVLIDFLTRKVKEIRKLISTIVMNWNVVQYVNVMVNLLRSRRKTKLDTTTVEYLEEYLYDKL